MSVRFICKECLNAYSGHLMGGICGRCRHKLSDRSAREAASTALAEDLVRGTAKQK